MGYEEVMISGIDFEFRAHKEGNLYKYALDIGSLGCGPEGCEGCSGYTTDYGEVTTDQLEWLIRKATAPAVYDNYYETKKEAEKIGLDFVLYNRNTTSAHVEVYTEGEWEKLPNE